MRERVGRITQNTLIPIGLAVLVIGGGSGWVTKQELMAADNAKAIEVTIRKFDQIEIKLIEISERLGRIEGQIKRSNREHF